MDARVDFRSVSGIRRAGFSGGGSSLYALGYATLVFGLMARIARPDDQLARIVIAVGSGMLLPTLLDVVDMAFKFSHVPVLGIVHTLLWFTVLLLAVACAVFVVPPKKLPPALQAVDAFGPLLAAVLLAWLPIHVFLFNFGILREMLHGVMNALILSARGFLAIVAYFSVLMMAAPAAYEEAQKIFARKPPQGGPPPGQGGGGYAPPQQGYAPPQQGYPQQGGYAPPGGGYPQQ